MSTYDSYDVVDEPRRHKSHRHHRDRDSRRDRDDYPEEPRYVETKETYIRGNPAVAQAPDPPFVTSRTTDVIRRPQREDSDLSIEEVRRDFPPPAGGSALYARGGRDDYRARSADNRGHDYDYNQRAHGAYRDDPRYLDRDRERDYDDRRGRGGVLALQERVEKPRRRSLSRNQKIIAGVAGAALAIGGKELFDRRGDLKHAPEHRNILGTAAIGAAGAFAGYEGAEFASKRLGGKDEVREKNYAAVRDKNGEVAEYYDSDEETVKSHKKPSRRKSLVDGALALAGVGGAKAALDSRDRSKRGKDDYSSDDRKSTRSRKSRRNSGENDGLGKVQQAAKAALLAGAAEAFRVRNEPGGWAGAKGKRILTAAIGASAIDAAADRDPEHKSKRHILEAVIGGLAGNRLVNGSRREIEEDRDGRSVHGGGSRSRSRGARSRSRAPSVGGGGGAGGPLAALAAAGLAGLAGKKVLDRDRSRSRGGDDRRRRYSSSDDDRPRGEKKRSKSVTDYARKGLAALGIGEAANESRDGHSREVRDVSRGDRNRRRRGSDDDYDDRRRSRGDLAGPTAAGAVGGYVGSRSDRDRGGDYSDEYDDTRSRRNGRGGDRKEGKKARRVAEGKQSESSSDLGSSSGDEKRAKKMKGKQLITAGLATVATIHAAHNVYQSVEKRDARHKAVAEGEMTPEEAHKLKMKARLQDAASIGIAALGIKGAYSEWKEMKEMRDECREFESKKEERHRKRLERLRNAETGGNRSNGRKNDNLRPPSRRLQSSSSPDLRSGGPPRPVQYIDDNPYNQGPLPPPPAGYGYDYDDRR